MSTVKIKKSDLKGYSFDDMLTDSYGKPGTKRRISAEKRIKAIEERMISEHKEKIAAHKEYKKAQTALYNLLFTDVDRIFSDKEIVKIKTFKKTIDTYQKKYLKFL